MIEISNTFHAGIDYLYHQGLLLIVLIERCPKQKSTDQIKLAPDSAICCPFIHLALSFVIFNWKTVHALVEFHFHVMGTMKYIQYPGKSILSACRIHVRFLSVYLLNLVYDTFFILGSWGTWLFCLAKLVGELYINQFQNFFWVLDLLSGDVGSPQCFG